MKRNKIDSEAVALGSSAGYFIEKNMVGWFLEKHLKAVPAEIAFIKSKGIENQPPLPFPQEIPFQAHRLRKHRASGQSKTVFVRLERAERREGQIHGFRFFGGENTGIAKIQGVEKTERSQITSMESNTISRMCSVCLNP